MQDALKLKLAEALILDTSTCLCVAANETGCGRTAQGADRCTRQEMLVRIEECTKPTSPKQKLTILGSLRESLANAAVDALREWCASQKELWQQVPYLSLQADGVTGFLSSHQICYTQGIYSIRHQGYDQEFRAINVDCATGRLVQWGSLQMEDADSSTILQFVDHYEELDAETIIANLKAQAAAKSAYQPERTKEINAWRKAKAEELQLTLIFTR